MSTRSAIAISTDHGIEAIYCHWDGYIENNGRILQEHYRDPSKVTELMALGDLSSLHDTPNECEAYCRDRGEPELQTRSRVYASYYEMLTDELYDSDREYLYILLKSGDWCVVTPSGSEYAAVKLSDAIAEIKRAEIRSV